MDQTWEQKLADILTKEPAALTTGDIEFLRARRSYLAPEQLSLYAEVLGEAKPAEGADASSARPTGKKK